MYSGLAIFGLGLVVWLAILSYFFWKDRRLLRKVFPGQEQSLKDRLEQIFSLTEEVKARDRILNRNIRELAKEGLGHTQKIALLRYNPYGDTGGDQSFSIAMLDGMKSGFVLTSLHTRAGTRVYAKSIAKGACDHKLSKEEAQVIEQACQEA